MKYLWLSFFENSGGRLPLFIEIRQINTSTTVNIRDFLYHSVIRTGASISQANFDKSIRQGEVILFLDGFDEIVPDKRRDAEIQIQQLRENNPRLTVVMTSRPDDRFAGWHQFEPVAVLPMLKKEAELLIERATYDEASKARLLKRIKAGLYESHESFLSNPLLAYMMLLTIARNPDIPNKMSAFYELAFDALYHRHDTVKGGGYIRKYYTSMDKHQFIRLLSYFCLSTYYDGVTEAPDHQMIYYIDVAREFESIAEGSAEFLRDLVENVCILKKDGIHFNFIHRSFQEYFAAVCICRVANRDIEEIFGHFSERYNDEVLPMVLEMDPDLFREKYLMPMRRRYVEYFDLDESALKVATYLNLLGQFFRAEVHGSGRRARKDPKAQDRTAEHKLSDGIMVTLEGKSEFSRFVASIQNLPGYGRIEDSIKEGRTRIERRHNDERFFARSAIRFGREANGLKVYSDGGRFILADRDGTEILDPWVEKEFSETYMYDYMLFHAERTHRFTNTEVDQYAKVTQSFADMIRGKMGKKSE